jgi:hypothetical protein
MYHDRRDRLQVIFNIFSRNLKERGLYNAVGRSHTDAAEALGDRREIHMTRDRDRRGLVLVEAVVVVALLALAVALFIPLMSRTRSLASSGESMNNLRWQSQMHAQYNADFENRFAVFSWTKDNCPSSYPDLQFATTDMEAAANQAVDIVRRLWNPSFAKVTSWVPHILHGWSVLADYQQMRIPARVFASPHDSRLLKWQNDPSMWQANQAPNARAPFWSSYASLPTAFYDQSITGNRIFQGSSWNTYTLSSSVILRSRLASDVAFPAQKALSWDRYQRDFGTREAYYLYNEARVPVLFSDGAVAQRQSSTARFGWNPNSPSNTFAQTTSYNPTNTNHFPAPLYSSGGDTVTLRYDWTRSDLAGRDFDPGQ